MSTMTEHTVHARNLMVHDQIKHFLGEFFTITSIVHETHEIVLLKLRREDEIGIVETEVRVYKNARIAVYFPTEN